MFKGVRDKDYQKLIINCYQLIVNNYLLSSIPCPMREPSSIPHCLAPSYREIFSENAVSFSILHVKEFSLFASGATTSPARVIKNRDTILLWHEGIGQKKSPHPERREGTFG